MEPTGPALQETPGAPPQALAAPEIDAALVDAPQLTSIFMLDELNGWGITETAVVRTNDGGVTWYDLTPPGLSDLGFAVRESFLDADHAWILAGDPTDFLHAGTLYRTQDGGQNWTSNSVPFGEGDLTFLDAMNGWMMADLGAGAGSNAVAVHQTTDGGATWNRTYVNDPNVGGAGDSLPLGGIKYGLIPLNMQTAWIGGVVYSPGVVYLFRTDDAGHSWSPVELTLPERGYVPEPAFEDLQIVSAQTAFLTVRMTGAADELAVYVSNDAGQTWSLTPSLIPAAGMADFASVTDGVAWNGFQFFVTRDGSQTWTGVSPDILFGESLAAMDFVSADVGWVITYDTTGRFTLYKTTDSGATWTSLFP